jgi:hypothetical protein
MKQTPLEPVLFFHALATLVARQDIEYTPDLEEFPPDLEEFAQQMLREFRPRARA